MQYLNILFFLILSYWGLKFLFSSQRIVSHPFDKKQKLLFEGPELYLVLMMSTGLLSLAAPIGLDLSAIRLLALEIFCIIGLSRVRHKPIWTATSIFYVLLIIWMCIGLFYTSSISFGIRVILKFIYAFLVILFTSAVVRDGEVFLKSAFGARWMAIITIILNFTHISRLFPGTIWYSTALAINYIVMCVFSLAMYYYGGKKRKDLYLTLLFMIPCVVWVFRTSIMGTALAIMVFMFFKYRLRSLPFIGGILVLFIVAIFTIPSVKNKMFRGENKTLTEFQEGKVSMDDIDSNGRFAMWEWSLDTYYKGRENIGSGTGNLQRAFYALEHGYGTIKIVHNDYVQILCDNGLIGLILFAGAFLSLIIHSFIVFQKRRYPWYIKVCAITAGASATGILLTMYTDNVINYTMATISYPCAFYGMMLGLEKGYKQKQALNSNRQSLNEISAESRDFSVKCKV